MPNITRFSKNLESHLFDGFNYHIYDTFMVHCGVDKEKYIRKQLRRPLRLQLQELRLLLLIKLQLDFLENK